MPPVPRSPSGTTPPPASSRSPVRPSGAPGKSPSGTAPPPVRRARTVTPPPRKRTTGPTSHGKPRTGGPVSHKVERQKAPAPAPAPGGGRSPGRARGALIASGGGKNYQQIIIAEFVLAELLIIITPFAAKKNKSGLSPYSGSDAMRTLAAMGSYFLLALLPLAGPKWGRLGAWFGGLILLVLALGQGTSVAKDLQIFGGTPQSAGQAAAAGAAAGAVGGAAG